MTRKIVLVRHGDNPPDDRVVSFAVTRGFEPVFRRPFKGEALDDLGPDVAGTVVFGGPFAVFEEDRFPFLRDEADWIARCMDRDLPVLGICQGAQQIARLLGAEVAPCDPPLHEFGYYPVSPTEAGRDFLPQKMHMVEAHFHTFAIPKGAVHLATGEGCRNQAFRMGARTFGVQFHPEVTIEGFRRWQDEPWAAYGEPGAQTRAEQDRLMMAHDAAMAAWFYGFLDWLFAVT
ncbi:MAG: glutamine amidotransferase [Rhodobacteraceae bacterium]|nr:glutamine amidotransferase [Paracoccaceae bacterium]